MNDELIIKMKKEGHTWAEIGKALSKSGNAVRCYAREKPWYDLIRNTSSEEVKKDEVLNTKKRLSDGSISSFIRERLSEQKTFTEKELLELHGFNPKEFQIKTVTSNEWSMTNGDGEKYYNFQSKIIAEKVKGVDKLLENLIDLIEKHSKPTKINYQIKTREKESIILTFPDLHFGPNTYEDYKYYQEQILELLETNYRTIIIGSLGDQINTDNFIHTTVSGTRVNDTNVPMAWDYSCQFFEPIIQKALESSNDVRYIYNRGNHDESIAWAFTKYIETKYPQMKMDNSLEQLKVTLVDEVAIYTSHGHKRNKQLSSLCPSIYPKEWGLSETRMLLTGHYHFLKTEDQAGIIHYQLPTIAKETEYEKDNLFLGAKKLIHVFFLSKNDITGVRYI